MPIGFPEDILFKNKQNAIEAKVKQLKEEGRPIVPMNANTFLNINYHWPRDRKEVDISRLKHFASQKVKAKFPEFFARQIHYACLDVKIAIEQTPMPHLARDIYNVWDLTRDCKVCREFMDVVDAITEEKEKQKQKSDNASDPWEETVASLKLDDNNSFEYIERKPFY